MQNELLSDLWESGNGFQRQNEIVKLLVRFWKIFSGTKWNVKRSVVGKVYQVQSVIVKLEVYSWKRITGTKCDC